MFDIVRVLSFISDDFVDSVAVFDTIDVSCAAVVVVGVVVVVVAVVVVFVVAADNAAAIFNVFTIVVIDICYCSFACIHY